MFKVESGAPYPIVKPRNAYPFRDMKVGDSFAFEGISRQATRVRNAARGFAHRNGGKFSVVETGKESPGGGIREYRCFRMA